MSRANQAVQFGLHVTDQDEIRVGVQSFGPPSPFVTVTVGFGTSEVCWYISGDSRQLVRIATQLQTLVNDVRKVAHQVRDREFSEQLLAENATWLKTFQHGALPTYTHTFEDQEFTTVEIGIDTYVTWETDTEYPGEGDLEEIGGWDLERNGCELVPWSE